MFSASAPYAVTSIRSPSWAIAQVAASTAAAPAMSHFMVYMPSAGLRFSPPVSKVIPLPTRARWALAPRGR